MLLCRRTSGQSTQRSKAQPEPSKRSSSGALPDASKAPGSAGQDDRAASPKPGDLAANGSQQADAATGASDVVLERPAEEPEAMTRDMITAAVAQKPAEPRCAAGGAQGVSELAWAMPWASLPRLQPAALCAVRQGVRAAQLGRPHVVQ